VEGDTKSADRCAVYDEGESVSSVDALHNADDISELCARLFVTESRVGVLFTRDMECTARILGLITSWLISYVAPNTAPRVARVTGTCDECVTAQRQNLRDYVANAEARDRSRSDLVSSLHASGVKVAAVEILQRRFASSEEIRSAIKGCDTAACRELFFDFSPVCMAATSRVWAALGLGSPPEMGSAPQQRYVHLAASPELAKRLGTPSPETRAIVDCLPDLAIDAQEGCNCMITVYSGQQLPNSQHRCSKTIAMVVVPGARLVHDVLTACRSLGFAAPAVALAEEAARHLAERLLQPVRSNNCRLRMLVLEGLRAACLSEARAGADTGQGVNDSAARRAFLPNLLSVVELAVLMLEFRTGWRTRVHESRPRETTLSFIRTLVNVARDEIALTRFACWPVMSAH
jgi:hypothetical protein